MLLLGLFIFSCKSDKKENTSEFFRAFYYWQTDLNGFNFEDSTFNTLQVDKLYVRLFDVDWDNEAKRPVPVSPISMAYNDRLDSLTIVPVVFITNETFQHLNLDQSKKLAHQVHKKIMGTVNRYIFAYWHTPDDEGYWEQNPYSKKAKSFRDQARKDSVYQARLKLIPEIQFDCDWTASTKAKYFVFITEYKKLNKTQAISSTIRLYQYKYPDKAGVPPVERGMLMCYNAGNIRQPSTINSLFDKKEVLSYVKSRQYPLPMDYALPIFSWGILFQGGQFKNILSMKDLAGYAKGLLRI